jgi:glycine/D-amino acid oxidase-like deaminating enzyme
MKDVVIVGGGFAGPNCARKLAARPDVRTSQRSHQSGSWPSFPGIGCSGGCLRRDGDSRPFHPFGRLNLPWDLR